MPFPSKTGYTRDIKTHLDPPLPPSTKSREAQKLQVPPSCVSDGGLDKGQGR